MIIKLDHYTITIASQLFNLFKKYIQVDLKSNESGGILIGNSVTNKKEVYIHKITEPNIYDKSNRFGFKRDKQVAQAILDFEFNNSNGKNIYLGEWHTHPEKNASPSSQDRKMIIKQLKKNKLNSKYICMVIIGVKTSYIALYSKDGLIEEASFNTYELGN